MADSHTAPDAEAESKPDKPATFRLVIRAKIIPEEIPPPPEPSSDRRAPALIVGGIAALLALGLIAFSVIRGDSPSTRSADEATHAAAPPSPKEAASVPAVAAPATSTQAHSVESTAASQPDTSLSPLNEVLPNPSRNALQTIRGTIRVSIRVTIDKQGAVTAATSDEPGPSRYFERLALEAARKWTFTPDRSPSGASAGAQERPPSQADQPRSKLLRFHFTRNGVTARAEAVP